MITIFTHATRPTQILLKVSTRVGDDFWILTNGVELATIAPTSKKVAMRTLTAKNGWKMEEIERLPELSLKKL